MDDNTIIFMSDGVVRQGNDLQFCDIADRALWVAWRNEIRPRYTCADKATITKVPYSTPAREARSNDPTTWHTLDGALEVAEKIITNLGGGIGLMLGSEVAPGLLTGGVDLDSCRDPATGEVDKWALKVIRRYRSYTEVSPSGTGAKIFFLYRASDWPEIGPLLGSAKSGRQWKQHADHQHPPGIELYLRLRYFAVTANVPAGFPDRLRVVEPADLRWLVEDFGPRFRGRDQQTRLPVTGAPSSKVIPKAQSNDNSRSARAYRWMRLFHRMGKTYPEAKHLLLNLVEDPDVATWAATKGMAADERELRRVYNKSKPPAGSVDDRLGEIARAIEEDRLIGAQN